MKGKRYNWKAHAKVLEKQLEDFEKIKNLCGWYLDDEVDVPLSTEEFKERLSHLLYPSATHKPFKP